MPAQSPKRPRDPNQLAKYIVDQSTGEIPKEGPPQKNKGATHTSKSQIRRVKLQKAK